MWGLKCTLWFLCDIILPKHGFFFPLRCNSFGWCSWRHYKMAFFHSVGRWNRIYCNKWKKQMEDPLQFSKWFSAVKQCHFPPTWRNRKFCFAEIKDHWKGRVFLWNCNDLIWTELVWWFLYNCIWSLNLLGWIYIPSKYIIWLFGVWIWWQRHHLAGDDNSHYLNQNAYIQYITIFERLQILKCFKFIFICSFHRAKMLILFCYPKPKKIWINGDSIMGGAHHRLKDVELFCLWRGSCSMIFFWLTCPFFREGFFLYIYSHSKNDMCSYCSPALSDQISYCIVTIFIISIFSS